MKLLLKTALYLFLVSLPIAIFGVIGLNWFIHKSTLHEIDEILLSHFKNVERKLEKLPENQLELIDLDDNPHLEITSPSIYIKPVFIDSTEVDLQENKLVPMRVLKATVQTSNHTFLVIVKQPYAEFEEIAANLSVGIGICFLALLITLLLLNFVVYRQLWKPFYRIIDELRTYQLNKKTNTIFKPEATEEFNLLSNTLRQMTERIYQQFSLQKQFTENASHEIQTPIAVISAELETLLQSENIPEKELFHIQKSTEALQKISQLNKSLLLLTKIENNQFSESICLNLSDLVSKMLSTYQEFAAHREIVIFQEIEPAQQLKINLYLAEILVGNLLKNAIRYNQKGGRLTCVLADNELTIINTGETLPFPKEQLFNRFVKHPKHPEATGLGLAIVKQIAEYYDLKLSYQFDEQLSEHIFKLKWQS